MSPQGRWGLRASVIIPAYKSEATAAATLASLRAQTMQNFETILVDSGPTDAVADIAKEFPEVRYLRSPDRLLPHGARNAGVALAQSDLLVFTDPDVVAPPEWLENLTKAHRANAGPVVGTVASLRRGWLETGIHLAKFDLWLSGGKARAISIAPTVNFACSRAVWEEAGGFEGNEMIGDTLLSWELVRRGQTLRLAPEAVLYHDHRSTFGQLLRERFVRGADFGRLRQERGNWSALRIIAVLCASVLPIRLMKLLGRTFACSLRAGCLGDFMRTLPITAGAHAAWLAGEASEYLRHLRSSCR